MIADKVKNQLFARSLEKTKQIKFQVDRKVEAPASEIKSKTRVAAENISQCFKRVPQLLLQVGSEQIVEALGPLANQPTDFVLEQIVDLVKDCREL